MCNFYKHYRDREWICKKCGSHYERDLLAAKNIKHFGLLKQNKIGWEAPECPLWVRYFNIFPTEGAKLKKFRFS